MNQRTLFIIALVAIMATLVLWQPWQDEQQAPGTEAPQQAMPDFTAENLVSQVFDADGRLTHRIQASQMAHFSKRKLTELNNPIYATYLNSVGSEDTAELWQVTALEGHLYDDEKLELLAEVEVTNLTEIGYIRHIELADLTIDLVKKTMVSQSPVVISGPQFTIRGIGLTIDIETQQLELMKHVETIYYPARTLP
ncbi:LPS export ABC transporter periplasmic protein LptC [Aliidiomarina taiwanensis]|uniref:Lipopolysaccharide export system protein LptC n=1 Tax=Aliidiomarina taiwanensis TaxID=946228 RepID=A0A432X7S2_9GAMM|nr:LPS export ABC transporter periplasmic protein LptC [Aliidiomarina taiwanensis]RUO42856.1 LPS export ABC transporter periplasmic protein LptC [Aliidiomarina taiwanensis]